MSKGQVNKEHNDMGMAASQARLLCITARIHDVEYQSQAIQESKLQLATQSDRAYDDYNKALAATTLTINALNVGTGQTSIIAANFNNLCSRNRVTPANGEEYALRNKNGLLIVEDDIEVKYNNFVESGNALDPYTFAMYMLEDVEDIDLSEELPAAEEEALQRAIEDGECGLLSDYYESMMQILDKYSDLDDINDKENDLYTAAYDNENKEAKKDAEKYESLKNAYRAELYRRRSEDILYNITNEEQNTLSDDAGKELFNYYVSIFKQIQACGGCISIEEYNGSVKGEDTTHSAANDTEWLQGMIQSGYFTIEIVETDKKTGLVKMDATSPSSDSVLTYTTTSTIDNTALAKAEAKYEHTLREIDKKDQKFDLDLSKLETERKALTTEYESVKKVIGENIDRTFGIFS